MPSAGVCPTGMLQCHYTVTKSACIELVYGTDAAFGQHYIVLFRELGQFRLEP